MTNFIFWQQALRVTGPANPANAEARLRDMLAIRQFSMKDRLAGFVHPDHIRVWKTTTVGIGGDVVEFKGEVRPCPEGTVIEGSLRYKTHSKIQFIGLLAMGLGFTLVGAFQKYSSAQPAGDLFGIGLVVSFITLFWIYASSQMRHTQIEYIEARLNEAVAA